MGAAICGSMLVLSPGLAVSAQAQQLPDSGSVIKQTDSLPSIDQPQAEQLLEQAPLVEPPSKDPHAKQITLDSIEVVGAEHIPQHKFAELLKEFVGQQHDFNSLKNVAYTVSQYYRREGYMTAWAFLPPQNLADKHLKVKVLEGRLEAVKIRAEGRLNEPTTARFAQALGLNSAIKTDEFERQLRLLNDLAGVSAKATLAPGDEVGSSVLTITTKNTPLFSGNVSADNMGNRYTKANRLGAYLQLNNSLGFGEQFQFRFAGSGQGFKFGSLGLELPLGGDGLSLSLSSQYSESQLLEDFKSLQAKGDSQHHRLGLSYPWLRSLNSNINVELQVSHSRYEDRSAAAGVFSDRTLQALSLNLSGDHKDDDGNFSFASLSIKTGDNQDKLLARQDDAYDIEGKFYKLHIQLQHSRWLAERWRLSLNAQLQYSPENLSSGEKLNLGGPTAVQAYPQGEGLVDSGGLLQAELNYHFNAQWQSTVFYEHGLGNKYQTPLASDSNNHQNIAGLGLKLIWRPTPQWYLNVAGALRTESLPSSASDKSPRLWAQLVHQF